jgi:hypothetical protein
MNKYAITRIIGNELPPRDAVGNRVRSLRFILDNEPAFPDCSKIWVVNQVEDDETRGQILQLLKPYQVEVLRLNQAKFRQCKTFDEKVIEAINVNKARNIGIDISKDYRFTFLFDGDCFFTQQLWDMTLADIAQDRESHKYYGVPGVRIVESIPANPLAERMWEPSMVFRDDATLRHDETIPFGKSERLEFMKRLGYVSKAGITKLEHEKLCKNVGCLLHISFNESVIESDLGQRMNAREESIRRFVKLLEQKYSRKMYI